MRRNFVPISLVLVLVVCAFASSLVARQTAQDPDVLRALIVEVRGLRAAMEQLAGAGPRVQLAMGRLQLNEQRITTLVRRLDEIRDRRIAAEVELTTQKERVSELEDAIQRGRLPASSETDGEVKHLRAAMAEVTARLQRLQNEEAAISQEVATEQSRWSEINQRLEELDRALTRR